MLVLCSLTNRDFDGNLSVKKKTNDKNIKNSKIMKPQEKNEKLEEKRKTHFTFDFELLQKVAFYMLKLILSSKYIIATDSYKTTFRIQ